jgi:crotonobetaine/carnitine-CoA ligase
MTNSQPAPGIVGPFAGLDVPWLLRMRAESRRNHPFLIWAPFEGPARKWSYGEFHERVGQLSAGLAKRGIKPGEYVLIHLDNCIEAVLAWFACVELGAIASPPTPARRRRKWNISPAIAARSPPSPSPPMPN